MLVGIWWEFEGTLLGMEEILERYLGVFETVVGIWWEFGGNLVGI